MSRAFVREDSPPERPAPAFDLPAPGAPGHARASAAALLEAARRSDIAPAELATGYQWGDLALAPLVTELLHDAERRRDDRLVQVAERFLRRTGVDLPL